MKKIAVTILLMSVLSFTPVFGQKTVNVQHQTWTQFYVTARLSETWSISADAFYRWKDFDGKKVQEGTRVGVNYHFKAPVTLSGGYAFFNTPTNAHDKYEHRPWQQLTFNNTIGRIAIQHRYRFEQRFFQRYENDILTKNFDFNFRLRYQLNLQAPINKKKLEKGALFLFTQNELMVNFGKQIVANYFDQNRSAVGFGYYFMKPFYATLGYQYIWQEKSNGKLFNSTNCLRLTFHYAFDFRKEK